MAHRGVLFSTSSVSSPPRCSTRCATARGARVRISRQATSLHVPAAFQLVACSTPVLRVGAPSAAAPTRSASATGRRMRGARSSIASTYACASTRPSQQRRRRRVVGGCRGRVAAAPTGNGAARRLAFAQNAHVAAGAVAGCSPWAAMRRGVARPHRRSQFTAVAPPASDGWPAPSPISTTLRASRRPRRQCAACEETCVSARAARRPADARSPPEQVAGAILRRCPT